MAIYRDVDGQEEGYSIRLVATSRTDLIVEVRQGEEATVVAFGIGELIQRQLDAISRDLEGDMFLTAVELRRWRRWARLLEVQANMIRATISEACEMGEPLNIADIFSEQQQDELHSAIMDLNVIELPSVTDTDVRTKKKKRARKNPEF